MSRVRDEGDAYEKLQRSLRYAEEACVELGTRRSDGRWAQMAEGFRVQRNHVIQLAMTGKASRLLQ